MQGLLKESWKPEVPEDGEEPIAAFDPTSPEYTVRPLWQQHCEWQEITTAHLSMNSGSAGAIGQI